MLTYKDTKASGYLVNKVRSLAVAGILAVLVPVFATLVPSPGGAVAHGEEVIIKGFPSVRQWYNLSCEYAAAAAVTLYWGNGLVSQSDFVREIPNHPNPHIGFRGNIHGAHGGITNYGVYAEPLVPVLEKRGYDATVFYGGVERLKAEIADGHPVVVWMTTGKDVHRQGSYHTYEGQRFKLVPSEHSVVAYGYDDAGIYVMDVSDGGFYYTNWESFLRRWGYFDEMALLIHPR